MEKYQDHKQNYYSSKMKDSKKFDPIYIQDSYFSNSNYKNDRRHHYQREDLSDQEKVPQFLKKTQLPKSSYQKIPQYYETTKSLIFSQKQYHFRQDPNSKGPFAKGLTKTPLHKDQNNLLQNSPYSNKDQKKSFNLTFDNFLQMAKRQKQRSIPIYTVMCNPRHQRFTHKTQSNIVQELRETQDTISDNHQFFKLNQPKVSDFHQVRLLGKGKNGQVYLTIHKNTGFACAMKIIKKSDINRGTSAQREIMKNQLLRQIKLQTYLSHPNLIQLYCVFCDKENIYLIQQLGIDGQLYEFMKKKTRLSEESTALVSRQVLRGLKAMHQKNIIHRDIKPENIVLIYGIAKLCDFGWSVYCPTDLRSTLCGTPLYLSPQILTGGQYNQKIDIWAYGTLVYELFTGQNPFRIKNRNQLTKIITDELEFAQNFPRRLKEFIKYILNKKSSERPQAKDIQNCQFLKKYAQLQTSQQLSNI